jgi:hypothetical protein
MRTPLLTLEFSCKKTCPAVCGLMVIGLVKVAFLLILMYTLFQTPFVKILVAPGFAALMALCKAIAEEEICALRLMHIKKTNNSKIEVIFSYQFK